MFRFQRLTSVKQRDKSLSRSRAFYLSGCSLELVSSGKSIPNPQLSKLEIIISLQLIAVSSNAYNHHSYTS